MKPMLKMTVVLASAVLMAGCVESYDGMDSGYSSSYTSNNANTLSGYNSTYSEPRHFRQRRVVIQQPATPASPIVGSGGYSSSGSVGSQSTSGGYSSSTTVTTAAPIVSSGGYDSSVSNSGGYSSAETGGPVEGGGYSSH